MSVHGCWSRIAHPHPWIPGIADRACGYDERLTDRECQGCHRSRVESPLDQLAVLDDRHNEDGIRK